MEQNIAIGFNVIISNCAADLKTKKQKQKLIKKSHIYESLQYLKTIHRHWERIIEKLFLKCQFRKSVPIAEKLED